MAPNVVGSGIHCGIYFTIYDSLKQVFKDTTNNEVLTASNYFLVGVITGKLLTNVFVKLQLCSNNVISKTNNEICVIL